MPNRIILTDFEDKIDAFEHVGEVVNRFINKIEPHTRVHKAKCKFFAFPGGRHYKVWGRESEVFIQYVGQ
jgi:hypothetical protein